jgi:hypothetical protein
VRSQGVTTTDIAYDVGGSTMIDEVCSHPQWYSGRHATTIRGGRESSQPTGG